MAEKDFEGQEDIGGGGGGGSKPNVANLGSLPIYGKAAKTVGVSKRATKAVRGKTAKPAAKVSKTKTAYYKSKAKGKGGKGKP